jgi:hypothetical protein
MNSEQPKRPKASEVSEGFPDSVREGFKRMRHCPDGTLHDWTEKIFVTPEAFVWRSTCLKCGHQMAEWEER